MSERDELVTALRSIGEQLLDLAERVRAAGAEGARD